jgi:hypothetical protein
MCIGMDEWGCDVAAFDREQFRAWLSEVRRIASEEGTTPELVGVYLVGRVPEENRTLLHDVLDLVLIESESISHRAGKLQELRKRWNRGRASQG